MRQYIDFLFNELYPQQGAKGATYEKCFSLFAESESLTESGYLFKLNKSLQCEKDGRNGDAHAWGILTLCDLAGEIIKTREQLLTSSAEFNPLDIELKIALNLPGEKIENDEIHWHAFGLGVESMDSQAVYIAKVRERLEKIIITIPNNPVSGPLDELNRLSSLYVEVLAMLSGIGREF